MNIGSIDDDERCAWKDHIQGYLKSTQNDLPHHWRVDLERGWVSSRLLAPGLPLAPEAYPE